MLVEDCQSAHSPKACADMWSDPVEILILLFTRIQLLVISKTYAREQESPVLTNGGRSWGK